MQACGAVQRGGAPCPVAFCTAELKRPSAVVLDDALRCQLAQLPADAAHFWYGPNGEVQSAAALPSGAPRKRKRVELKKEPQPHRVCLPFDGLRKASYGRGWRGQRHHCTSLDSPPARAEGRTARTRDSRPIDAPYPRSQPIPQVRRQSLEQLAAVLAVVDGRLVGARQGCVVVAALVVRLIGLGLGVGAG
eukprot:scaffold6855_cov42-Phaeocystis_antarctica.AAC.4